MMTTLIGIQTICVGVSTYLAYKSTRKTKLKLTESSNGFKHYKGGY